MPETPEQKAREQIDAMLVAAGWIVQDYKTLDFTAGRGVAVRDVRSRVYFEQMKGRGTRVVTPTDLQSVSGEDARTKIRFVIVDCIDTSPVLWN